MSDKSWHGHITCHKLEKVNKSNNKGHQHEQVLEWDNVKY